MKGEQLQMPTVPQIMLLPQVLRIQQIASQIFVHALKFCAVLSSQHIIH